MAADGFAVIDVRPDTAPRTWARLTAEDFMALCEESAFGDLARVELVDGELVEMPPEGLAHGMNKSRTWRVLDRIVERFPGLSVTADTAVKLSSNRVVGPDVLVFKRPVGRPSPLPTTFVLLAVEHAFSSRRYDLDEKSRLYAEAGVQELWVLDNIENVLHRFHAPQNGAYETEQPKGLDEFIAIPFAPEISVRVGDLFDLD